MDSNKKCADIQAGSLKSQRITKHVSFGDPEDLLATSFLVKQDDSEEEADTDLECNLHKRYVLLVCIKQYEF